MTHQTQWLLTSVHEPTPHNITPKSSVIQSKMCDAEMVERIKEIFTITAHTINKQDLPQNDDAVHI